MERFSARPFAQELTQIFDGDYAVYKEPLRRLLASPPFAYRPIPNAETYRATVLEWLGGLAEHGLGAAGYPAEFGGAGDVAHYLVTMEMLGHHDLSLLVKFGVQFGLFGSSILMLGTRRHHERYLGGIGRLNLLGGFAMTEAGHGSNVRGLETTATFDPRPMSSSSTRPPNQRTRHTSAMRHATVRC